MAAEQREGARQAAAHLARGADQAVALGGEVALEADEVGGEPLAFPHAQIEAVEAQIDDPHLVPVALQHGGDAFQSQRLDQRDQLESEDAVVRRLDQSYSHRVAPDTMARIGAQSSAMTKNLRAIRQMLADATQQGRGP